MRSFTFLLLLTGLLTSLFCADPAHARRMEVLWGEGTGIENRNQALAQAFADAALAEALEILTPTPAPERSQALHAFLLHNSGSLIEHYTELDPVNTPDGTLLSAEVRVNPVALRELLKRCGIYYTPAGTVTYTLKIPETLAQNPALQPLPQLELLTGLQQAPNAPLQLSVQHDKKNFKLRLDGQGDINSASDADFALAWSKVWGGYFQRRSPTENASWFLIETRAWPNPDGIQQLSTLLESQKDVFPAVKMEGMNIGASGIEARWRVQTSNKTELERLVSSSVGEGVEYSVIQAP